MIEISNFVYIIKNKYKFTLYTDGYTIEDINYIPLLNGKYIIEDNLKPFIIDRKEKIGRRTEKKAVQILKKYIHLLT